jgi:hypothetical protein
MAAPLYPPLSTDPPPPSYSQATGIPEKKWTANFEKHFREFSENLIYFANNEKAFLCY